MRTPTVSLAFTQIHDALFTLGQFAQQQRNTEPDQRIYGDDDLLDFEVELSGVHGCLGRLLDTEIAKQRHAE